MVYARLSMKLVSPLSEKQKLIQKALNELIIKNNISSNGLAAAKILVWLVTVIHHEINKLLTIISRLGFIRSKKGIAIESHSHENFPDINSVIQYIYRESK